MIEIYDLSEEDYTPYLSFITMEAQAVLTSDGCCAVGIRQDNDPIGAVVADIYDPGAARISSLYVKEDNRRMGYGTELIYRVLTLILKKENINRLEARFAVTDGDDNGLYEFFLSLDFAFTKDDVHGAFMINLSDGAENEFLKKASSNGITAYTNTRSQVKNIIKAAHPMLTRITIDESISCVAVQKSDEDGCPDCLIFTKEGDTYVMAWAEAEKSPLNLMRMLRFSLDEITRKYGTHGKVRIPYIHEHSRNLIIKMMGDRAVTAETVWNAVLPMNDIDEATDAEFQNENTYAEVQSTSVEPLLKRKTNHLVTVTVGEIGMFESFMSKEAISSFLEDTTLTLIGFCSGKEACGVALLRFMPVASELYWLYVAPEKRNGTDDYDFFTRLLTLLYKRGNSSITVLLPVGENDWAIELFRAYGIIYEDSGTGVIHTTLERFFGGGLAPKKLSKSCKPLADVTDKELEYISSTAVKAGVDYVRMPMNRADYLERFSAVSYEKGKPVGIILLRQSEADMLTVSYMYAFTPKTVVVLELIRFVAEAVKHSYPLGTKLEIPFVDSKLAEIAMTKGNPVSIVRNKRGRISLDFIDRAMTIAEAEVDAEIRLGTQSVDSQTDSQNNTELTLNQRFPLWELTEHNLHRYKRHWELEEFLAGEKKDGLRHERITNTDQAFMRPVEDEHNLGWKERRERRREKVRQEVEHEKKLSEERRIAAKSIDILMANIQPIDMAQYDKYKDKTGFSDVHLYENTSYEILISTRTDIEEGQEGYDANKALTDMIFLDMVKLVQINDRLHQLITAYGNAIHSNDVMNSKDRSALQRRMELDIEKLGKISDILALRIDNLRGCIRYLTKHTTDESDLINEVLDEYEWDPDSKEQKLHNEENQEACIKNLDDTEIREETAEEKIKAYGKIARARFILRAIRSSGTIDAHELMADEEYENYRRSFDQSEGTELLAAFAKDLIAEGIIEIELLCHQE